MQDISPSSIEEIREIIVKLDSQELDYLKSILSDKELLASEIAKVLPSSFFISQKNSDELNISLIPIVEQVLVESINTKPEVITRALSPIIGKTIRKSINDEFKKLVNNFNAIIEQTLSAKSIKWHYQSLVTGKPYGEIVLLNTLGYDIQHILLIHKETGTLLNEVHTSEKLKKSPDLVSGMLRAIMDFAHDSIKTSNDDELETIEIGNEQVLIETGEQAIIAIVVKGFPPSNYREKIIDTLENIQQKFNSQLLSFNGDTTPFILTKSHLKAGLIFSNKDNKGTSKKKSMPFFKILATLFIIFVLFFGVKYIVNNYKWNKYTRLLQNTEGIFLTYSNKTSTELTLKGIRTFDSESPMDIATELKIDTSKLISTWQFIVPANSETIKSYINSKIKLPKTLQLKVEKNIIELSGFVGAVKMNEINTIIESKLSNFTLDSSDITIVTDENVEDLTSNIESTELFYKVGVDQLTFESENNLKNIIKFAQILSTYTDALQKKLSITIIGHTDVSGNVKMNETISLQRAGLIANIFIENNLDKDMLTTIGKGSKETVNENIPSSKKRRVEIEITIE